MYNECNEKAKSDYTYRRMNFEKMKTDGGEISGGAQNSDIDKVAEIMQYKSTIRNSEVGL